MQKIIIDANAILRYILDDIKVQADSVESVLRDGNVLILPEVMAEVVYVLTKYYNQPRDTAVECLLEFLEDANCGSEVLRHAVETFGKSKYDFVDCLLYEYSKQADYKVFTFDKDLKSLLKHELVKINHIAKSMLR